MLSGINNEAFFSGFGGFLVLALLLIPLLKWIFPGDKKTQEANRVRKKMRRDLKKLKKK